jgi:uncharacterized protein YbjT (DUF2867 family)
MTTPILVTGGTGTLGRLVVARLGDAEVGVRVLSRHGGPPEDGVEHVTGDLGTGEGIQEAVEGADVVVHCAGSRTGDGDKARQLVRAASRAGVRHLVHISVVGADRVPVTSRTDRAMFGYFGSKHEAEQVVTESGVPWSMLRATQFHDLTYATVRQMARLPVVPVPSGFRFQPVDASAVADRLVELARGTPGGLQPDLSGPAVYPMNELVRGYLRAADAHRLLVPVRVPGGAARAIRAGANLPVPGTGALAVGRTWEDFLAAAVLTSV